MENVRRIVNTYFGKNMIKPDCTPNGVVVTIKRECNEDAKYVGFGMVHVRLPSTMQHNFSRWGSLSTQMVLLEMIEYGIRNELAIACLFLLNRAVHEDIPDCNTFLTLECTRTALGRRIPTQYTSSTYHVVDAVRPRNISNSSWSHIKKTNEKNILNIVEYAVNCSALGSICRGTHIISNNVMHIHLRLRHGGAIYNKTNCNQLRIIMQHIYREYVWHWHRLDEHTFISSMGNVDRYPRHPVICVNEVSAYDIHEGRFSNGDVFIGSYSHINVYKQLYPHMRVITYNELETLDISIYSNIYIRYYSFPRIPTILARSIQRIICFIPPNANISNVHSTFAHVGIPCDTTSLSRCRSSTPTQFRVVRYPIPRHNTHKYIPAILLDRLIESCICSEGPEYILIPEEICSGINPRSSFTGDEECPICLERMKHLIVLDCSHSVCFNCYNHMIHHTCPLCRSPIYTYELYYQLNQSERFMNGAIVQSLPRIVQDGLYDIVKAKSEVGRNLFVTRKPMRFTTLSDIPLHRRHCDGGNTIMLMSNEWYGVPLYKLYDNIYFIDILKSSEDRDEIVDIFRNVTFLVPAF